MRRVLILLSLLIATGAVALDVPALVEAAPEASEFADADVVVLYQAETITVDELLRVTRRVHTVRRLQTQWAMRNEADVRVAWDDRRQDLEVITARTFMRDGTVAETPDNGFNDVTPGAVQRAVPFMDLREMVISHIGTEPGCVVELAYEVRDREPAAVLPSGTCWLGGQDPVLRAECTVQGPGVVSVATTSHDWPLAAEPGTMPTVVENLPGFAEVPGDQHRGVIPHVDWSTHAGTDHSPLARAVRLLGASALDAGPRLQAWLARTREQADVLTDIDLVRAIAALAHDEIADITLPTGAWSRPPRPAEAVYATAVGTTWERALVAMTLLETAGLEPELGLFGRHEATDAFAAPFTHWRVVVRIGQENWWLGPDRSEAWTGRCDLGGWYGVFLSRDGGQRAYQVREEPLVCRWYAHVHPDGDGWRAEADLELEGLRHDHAAAAELAAALADRLLAGGELDDLDIRHGDAHAVSLRMTATGKALAEPTDGLLWYQAPLPSSVDLGSLLRPLDLGQAQRRFDVATEHAARLEATVTVELPAGWQVDHPRPGSTSLSSAPLTLDHRCEEVAGGIRQVLRLELEKGVIRAAEWPEFRAAVAAAERVLAAPIVAIERP